MPDTHSENRADKSLRRPVIEMALSLVGSLTAYLQARLQLVQLEGKEAGARLLLGLLWLLAALFFAVFAYLFLVVTLIGILTVFVGLPWPWVVLGFGVAHLLLAVIGAFLARGTLSKAWFEETLRQLALDQQWISEWTQRKQTQANQP